MGQFAIGLLVAVVVGVAASRGLDRLGVDVIRTVPVSLAAGAIAAWPWARRWWNGSLAAWAARWVLAAAVVLAVTAWGCPAT